MMSLIEAPSLSSDELDPEGVATCPLHDAEAIAVVRRYLTERGQYYYRGRYTVEDVTRLGNCLKHHFGDRAVRVIEVPREAGHYIISVEF